MDEQTRKLYEECNTGCQMAIESMQQIKDFTQTLTQAPCDLEIVTPGTGLKP